MNLRNVVLSLVFTLFSVGALAAGDSAAEETAREKIGKIFLVDQYEVEAASGVYDAIPPKNSLDISIARDKRLSKAAKEIADVVAKSPELQKMLLAEADRNPNRSVRQQVVGAMGSMKAAWAHDFVIEKLEDEPVNIAATMALGNLGGAKSVAALTRVLTEKVNRDINKYDFIMRREAVSGLLKCAKPEEMSTTLRQVIREDDEAGTVGRAAEALGKLRVKQAASEIEAVILKREFRCDFIDDYLVKASALRGLAQIPGAESTAALETIVVEITKVVSGQPGRNLESMAKRYLEDQKKLK